jgi:hypothetical protein
MQETDSGETSNETDEGNACELPSGSISDARTTETCTRTGGSRGGTYRVNQWLSMAHQISSQLTGVRGGGAAGRLGSWSASGAGCRSGGLL